MKKIIFALIALTFFSTSSHLFSMRKKKFWQKKDTDPKFLKVLKNEHTKRDSLRKICLRKASSPCATPEKVKCSSQFNEKKHKE